MREPLIPTPPATKLTRRQRIAHAALRRLQREADEAIRRAEFEALCLLLQTPVRVSVGGRHA